jgi:hypothetical protein
VALDEPRPWRGRGRASISCAEAGAPRQPLQELQRREDQIPHAVVSSRLQLERNAAAAPPPQTLLGERRAQYISARVPRPRAIFRRLPHVGVQNRTPDEAPACSHYVWGGSTDGDGVSDVDGGGLGEIS